MRRFRIKRYAFGALFLSALLMAACQNEDMIDEPLPGIPGEEAGSVVLNFTVKDELAIADADNTGSTADATRNQGVSTRTDLPGSGNAQHVTVVRLYIFDGTSPNSTCVASEDIGWSAHFGNIPPTVTSSMNYRVKYSGLVNGNTYTFLAVGTDASSATTYGYPAAIVVGTTQLSNAIATLMGTEAITWKNMRQSELFAGATALTASSYGTQGNVDLWRRVAGVMGWFTNVPTSISGNAVANIRISLYTSQNKSVPLIQRSQTPVFADYLLNPVVTTGGQVLVEIPVPPATLPIAVLSKGSYVLPVPAPAPVNTNDYTLKVELVNAAGTILRSNRVTLSGTDDSNSSPGNGTGVIDPQGVYRFPIVANRFYGVGTSVSPINLGGTTLRNSIPAWIITDMNKVEIGK